MDAILLGFDEVKSAEKVVREKRQFNFVVHGHLASIEALGDLTNKAFYVDSWPDFSCLLCLAPASPKVKVSGDITNTHMYAAIYSETEELAVSMVTTCLLDRGCLKITFSAVPYPTLLTLEETMTDRDYSKGYYGDCRAFLHTSQSAPLLSSPPPGYEFHRLAESHAEQVNELYQYGGTPEKREALQSILARYPSVGAFSGGELAGFMYQSDFGMLQALTVREGHRGRGLGPALAAHLATAARARSGLDPYVLIEEENEAGRRTHVKAGFSEVEGAPVVGWWFFYQGDNVVFNKHKKAVAKGGC